MSIMSGFSFTPIISFICSFFILSNLDFLADLLSTSTSVAEILFISLVGICYTNISTEYFKHALKNAVYFIMLHFWFLYCSHFTYRVC
jgi:hypothetical protein